MYFNKIIIKKDCETMILKFKYTELVASLTETIDLVSPIVSNHHKLVAYISYSLGKELGLSGREQIELEIAGSMHDIGGLTLLERLIPTEFEYKDLDFHAEKGYLLLNKFKQWTGIAKMIRYHHFSWLNGKCRGINNQRIPFGSHILNLADRISLLVDLKDENILNSLESIREKVSERKGDVFHPKIVEAFLKLSKSDSFWLGMHYLDTPNFIKQNIKSDILSLNDKNCEDFMILMSCLVDYKSRSTAAHSSCVAICSEFIAIHAGFSENDAKIMRYAGYVHDIGKLAIPAEILEKHGPLSKEEFDLIRTHAYHTNRVLSKVSGFEILNSWASLHHEKLNGLGYPFGLRDEEIPLGSRIMAVADIFTALRERRSYREGMTKDDIINILVSKCDSYEIDKYLVEIVKNNFDELDIARERAYQNRISEFKKFTDEVKIHKDIMVNLEMSIIS